jgi:hypothetical protein
MFSAHGNHLGRLRVARQGHRQGVQVTPDPVMGGVGGDVAKTVRDRLMTRLAVRYDGYAWATNMGYGTADHLAELDLPSLICRASSAELGPAELDLPGLQHPNRVQRTLRDRPTSPVNPARPAPEA